MYSQERASNYSLSMQNNILDVPSQVNTYTVLEVSTSFRGSDPYQSQMTCSFVFLKNPFHCHFPSQINTDAGKFYLNLP